MVMLRKTRTERCDCQAVVVMVVPCARRFTDRGPIGLKTRVSMRQTDTESRDPIAGCCRVLLSVGIHIPGGLGGLGGLWQQMLSSC